MQKQREQAIETERERAVRDTERERHRKRESKRQMQKQRETQKERDEWDLHTCKNDPGKPASE